MSRRSAERPPSPRVILLTGKGGVGKSTLAAGTAALAAHGGRRTLVLSTDAAHSLGDALGCDAGPEPTEVGGGLFVQQVDAQRRFERSWAQIQGYLLGLLDAAGVDRLAAEEITVLPGAEEVLALLEVREQAASGRWDVIVVDCAPSAETLRLLALPEVLGWYARRMQPGQRRLARALAPAASRAVGVPMPDAGVVDALVRLHAELDEVRALLTGDTASVRIVLTPESVVAAEARRLHTTLSLYGFRVDGVIANRIFPRSGADPWRRRWVAAQDAVLADLAQGFEGLPIWRARYRESEPVGVAALRATASEAYAGHDPLAPAAAVAPLRVELHDAGARMTLALPLVERSQVALARTGDELVVTVGSYRRLLTLPAALAHHRIAGARVRDGALEVRFERVEETVS